MKVAFPSVRVLLGQQNFDTLAPLFVRAHPPASPLMMHYGADFPAFLEAFAPLTHLGYLSDVARLDLVMRASYHAADTPEFDAGVLQEAPEVLALRRIALAPATMILRSRWPLHDLWQRAIQPNAPAPCASGQAIMITRPAFDPQVHLLPTGAATWLLALHDRPLGASVDAATAAAPDFDFTAALGLALRAHAFCTPKKDT
jgi:hypothetical protein